MTTQATTLPKPRATGTRLRVHLHNSRKAKASQAVVTVRPLYRELPLLNQPLN